MFSEGLQMGIGHTELCRDVIMSCVGYAPQVISESFLRCVGMAHRVL